MAVSEAPVNVQASHLHILGRGRPWHHRCDVLLSNGCARLQSEYFRPDECSYVSCFNRRCLDLQGGLPPMHALEVPGLHYDSLQCNTRVEPNSSRVKDIRVARVDAGPFQRTQLFPLQLRKRATLDAADGARMSNVSLTSRDDLLCFGNGRDKLRLPHKLLDRKPFDNLAVDLLGGLQQLLDSNNDLVPMAALHINLLTYSTIRK